MSAPESCAEGHSWDVLEVVGRGPVTLLCTECGQEHAINGVPLGDFLEYAAHQSWRCEHPPHYYFAGDPPEDGNCACGLTRVLRRLDVPDDRVSGIAR